LTKKLILFELVERSNEAMMKITASIDANTKSMDTLKPLSEGKDLHK